MQNWSAATQAIATVIAVIVAVPSVWVGLDTLRAQQQINRSQLAVDQITQERFLHRYVSRVHWWQEGFEGYADVNGAINLIVENRSVAPLKKIQVLPGPNGTGSLISVVDLAPCTTTQLLIPPLKERRDIQDNRLLTFFPWSTRTVIFSDPSGTWREDYASPATAGSYSDTQGLSLRNDSEPTTLYLRQSNQSYKQIHIKETRRPAADCGEGA